ncbi:Vld1p SCDLUD_005191 [Saccharomycodes ludwigii]|uniref:Vld1p n=1 Tax=Saccharomycodes ludwigii TaxID=36035 RepID=UPI001E836938|nr:hypothetical protein SCDLUD_005191 [Saccharomycodes ludwigii]KAH3898852.1 hypothetical protein SCDLUD_005191 [Saccharomycodes ludwigii]
MVNNINILENNENKNKYYLNILYVVLLIRYLKDHSIFNILIVLYLTNLLCYTLQLINREKENFIGQPYNFALTNHNSNSDSNSNGNENYHGYYVLNTLVMKSILHIQACLLLQIVLLILYRIFITKNNHYTNIGDGDNSNFLNSYKRETILFDLLSYNGEEETGNIILLFIKIISMDILIFLIEILIIYENLVDSSHWNKFIARNLNQFGLYVVFKLNPTLGWQYVNSTCDNDDSNEYDSLRIV